MIILEGPDGAGKTWLAEQLSEDLRIPVAPKVISSSMTSTLSISVAEWVDKEIDQWPKPIIYDRFPLISEFIYGPVYKQRIRENFDSPTFLYNCYRAFYKVNPVIIYCLPPWENVWTNVHDEDTDNNAVNTDPVKLKVVYDRYTQEKARDFASLSWDYTVDLLEDLEIKIRQESYERNKIVY